MKFCHVFFSDEEQQRGSVRIRKLRHDAIPSPIPASPCSSSEHHSSVDDPQDDTPEGSSPQILRPKLPFDGVHLAVPGAPFVPVTSPVASISQTNGEKHTGASSLCDNRSPSKPGEADVDTEVFYLDSSINKHIKPIRTTPVPPPVQVVLPPTPPRSVPPNSTSFGGGSVKFASSTKFIPRKDIKRAYSPLDMASVLTSPNLSRKRESNVSDYTGLSLSPRNSLRQPDALHRPQQAGKRESTTSDFSDFLSPRNSMMSVDQKIPNQPSKRGSNVSDVSGYASSYRSSVQFSEASRNSLFASGDPTAPNSGKVGAVVTSSRRSGRR